MIRVRDAVQAGALGELSGFRQEFYRCLPARADALFELAEAVLCADGPVRSWLSCRWCPSTGAVMAACMAGSTAAGSRWGGCGPPWPACRYPGLLMDGWCWQWMSARGCARTRRPQRTGCSATSTGVAKGSAQMIPGWPYSFVAALETGRSSWTAVLDVIRLKPADDATAVTAAQIREVVGRLIAAGQWTAGDPEILIVADAGYDVTRLAFVLSDLPVVLLGRLRSDRVLRLPAPPRPPGTSGRPPRHGGEFALARPETWPAGASSGELCRFASAEAMQQEDQQRDRVHNHGRFHRPRPRRTGRLHPGAARPARRPVDGPVGSGLPLTAPRRGAVSRCRPAPAPPSQIPGRIFGTTTVDRAHPARPLTSDRPSRPAWDIPGIAPLAPLCLTVTPEVKAGAGWKRR